MKFLEAISSYLPSLVVAHVAGREEGTLDPPFRQSLDTVCLFADVSGFTKLSEAMANKFGPEGAEFVAKHLNSYFCQMIRIISGEGGDIFKFAGDAVIVLWPDVGDMAERARHAAQCALNVQGLLDAVRRRRRCQQRIERNHERRCRAASGARRRRAGRQHRAMAQRQSGGGQDRQHGFSRRFRRRAPSIARQVPPRGAPCVPTCVLRG